ncbi:MAG: patatin-like phospholipase family protein [Pseudomonadota bacterium]
MFNPDQKRLLSLDGGGILGVISLGALRKIEQDLRAVTGKPDLRLNEFFDYIAGTSTGAIIAAGLSLGKTVDELEKLYVEEGADIFDKKGLAKRLWTRGRSSYSHKKLTARLKREYTEKSILELQNEARLSRDKHLMVVTRNVETDSPWPVSTNPAAKYNDPQRKDCNLKIPLWQLVRASSAAPTYFAPERLQWDPSDPDKQFYFEDGGVTPYNNPAFLLFKMATAPEYRCGWESGEDKMMLISVGTSYSYRLLPDPHSGGEGLIATAKTLPREFMLAMAIENDLSCRCLGRCVAGLPLDREVGDLIPADGAKTDRRFLYARYDVETSAQALATAGLGDIDPDGLVMDNVKAIPDLQRIGRKLGEAVDLRAQFAPFL